MLTVAHATSSDVPAIARILDELDRFYGSTDTRDRTGREARIARELFDVASGVRALMAVANGEPVGLATYSFLWPAEGVTASLYLKELYVRESHRRHNVGRTLMVELCRIAQQNDCSRIEWTTETTNVDAIDFYGAFGGQVMTEKLFYRLDKNAIVRATSGAKQ